MNKTKLTVVSLAIALGFLANSCGSDDGPGASIVGKWDYFKTITQVEGQNPISQNYQGNEPGCDKDYQEFLADGSYRDVVLFQNQDDVCTESVDDGNYAKEGDVLTVQENGENPQTYTITKLTDGELRYSSTTQNGGLDFTVTLVFRKK
ncbi:lipocalin family protein [Flavobacterium sp. MAH-1]|uniref:Lipocalin family protein n=1 Tax=Flavobacterium agri TaxID=2743471 RepID=A0A7Y8Y495_9FLAO|nr:lipocalin family protein [Flavobacterium agri]NUY82228.1 lipocalin family protein [Flavobacterium agri]NYA72252.1 lipocalin family protein [Flavobacterium agri]